MALFAKTEGFRRVPWFSLAEWHQVYKQIYSNDTTQQTKGYETLLVWKARMPKLPVGVECTLSLIQVCLRDREWISKINTGELPMYYENDLSLMYSTTIMRFLNQISNIGHTKQTSLFQIAKQLKIPEWIVNLRHDAAHGHELPAIGLLRMAANMLLTWLHDEYWAAEGQAFEEQYAKESEIIETEDIETSQTVVDLIELWMAVGLYAEAGYTVVSELPDEHMQETLNELKVYTRKSRRSSNADVATEDSYHLVTAQSFILTEISALLGRNKAAFDKKQVLMNVLFESETFLPTPEILKFFSHQSEFTKDSIVETQLPAAMITFWQSFIQMLHERKMLESLTLKLLDFVNSLNEDKNRRLYAALWIKTIAQGLIKLKLMQHNAQTLEHSFNQTNKRLTPKVMRKKLREKIHSENPDLDDALWLNVTEEIPALFTNINFAHNIARNPNQFTIKFFDSILELLTPTIGEENKHHLSQLVRIYTIDDVDNDEDETDVIYTVEDVAKIFGNVFSNDDHHEIELQEEILEVADTKIRNNDWELAPVDHDWESSPLGILPWQIDSLEILHSSDVSPKLHCPDTMMNIIPGFVDNKHLLSSSRVNWENVLRKKQRSKKRKQKGDVDIMMDRAIEIVKTKKV